MPDFASWKKDDIEISKIKMARYLQTKSGISFYRGSLIIVSYFELLCNYHKRP